MRECNRTKGADVGGVNLKCRRLGALNFWGVDSASCGWTRDPYSEVEMVVGGHHGISSGILSRGLTNYVRSPPNPVTTNVGVFVFTRTTDEFSRPLRVRRRVSRTSNVYYFRNWRLRLP